MCALLMIVLGVLGVGSFAELALAVKAMNCDTMWIACINKYPDHPSCDKAVMTCRKNNAAMGLNPAGKPSTPPPGNTPPPKGGHHIASGRSA
jgi:hypothetical protein